MERETRYFLVKRDLYELAINYSQMTVNIYLVDPDNSTEERTIADKVILYNSLTANNFVNTSDDLNDINKLKIVYNCRSMTRQILLFKYEDDKKAKIAYFETLKEAFNLWQARQTDPEYSEYISRQEPIKPIEPDWTNVKDSNPEEISLEETKGCTLENIILEEDVKEDILSTINFVKNIEKYKEMGCTIPAGILLEGPPGTGKTLIAKTIANETNLKFKSLVASDLVQKYVGESAKRIEKEFDEIKKAGGGILFIDEIDAIGINRTSSDENKEYRSALNKLLACMSEAADNNIIVICATNVKDQLDPALIREGRIDKIIKVPLPDLDSRVKMFELYINKLKHEDGISYLELAEQTEGKSGAFIAACVNHSGIYAVDHGATKTSQEHLDHVLKRMLTNREDDDDNSGNTIGFI